MLDAVKVVDAALGEEASSAPPPPLSWIDMSNWDNEPVPEQAWAVPNRIPLRQCSLFSGEGAAGKSTAELHRSVAHVLARDWLGSMPEPGPAWCIDAEEEKDVMHRRLDAIIRHYRMTFDDVIKGGLQIMSLAGQEALLATVSRNGRVEPTTLYKQLLEAAGDIKPKSISIASCANVFAGDETVRHHVQQFISLLTRIAIVANGSVVLVSHPSLTGISSDTGISGSTQWHNAMRARFYMKSPKPKPDEQPDDDLREIVFKKNQYGPKAETIVLRYTDGMFLPVPGISSLDKLAREARADELFVRLVDETNRRNERFSSLIGAHMYAPSVFARDADAKAADSSVDRAVVERRPSKQRSRVSNGKDVLPDIDGRSAMARRFKDITTAVLIDQGGADQCSESRLQLVRRFAAAAVLAERLESRLANGEQIDVAEHAVLCSTLVRIAQRIGINRVPKNITPSLADYLQSHAADGDVR
jgi:RecA-family ATPase